MQLTLATLKDLVREAQHVLILAGAGMSAELSVPTYWTGPDAKYASTLSPHGYTELQHADAGLWRLDPAAQKAFFQQRYTQLLQRDPRAPGSPYPPLLQFLHDNDQDYFVVTSNVDSFFQRAGFDEAKLFEVHGAYRQSQCLAEPGQHQIFSTDPSGVTVCPTCGGDTRPNVMFFNDLAYNPVHMHAQHGRFSAFRDAMTPNWDVAIEVGAGNTVPTIRNHSVIMNGRYDIPVIRINPNPVYGVDGIARMVPKSKTAPFVHIKQPVGVAFQLLFASS